MSLWIPPAERARQLNDRREYLASIEEQRQYHAELKQWNKLLQAIDRRLEVFKAPDNAKHPALRPGYWHVLRREGSEVPPSILVHEGPDGEYRDLDSSLLERLRKGDMWSERSMKAMSDRNKAATRAAEKQKQQERSDRVEEVLDKYRYKHTTKIATGDGITA